MPPSKATSASLTARIERVERGLRPEEPSHGRPAVTATLDERMAFHGVPGVGIAVIDGGELAWARGYGVRDAEAGGAVTVETLFQAASISKPVTAVAVLRLVQAGQLELDRDVNEYLRSWKLPAVGGGTWQPCVTLRQLLSHTGGVTVHGFYGYRPDRPIPTLRQVLDGVPPANSAPIRVDTVPGLTFRYSGDGYTIVQQLVMGVTGSPFPELMRELVLDPLGMRASTFAQPLPEDRRAEAASAHRNGAALVPGGWHVYPEMAAAGLWTTPRELALFALALQRALECDDASFLRPALVRQMLSPQIGEGLDAAFGLGFELHGSADAREDTREFAHTGGNEGFHCKLTAFCAGGKGAVVMTNGDGGYALRAEIERAVAAEYGWAGRPVESASESAALDAATLAEYTGRYLLDGGQRLLVSAQDDRLTVAFPGQDPMPLLPVGPSRFASSAVATELHFVRDAVGRMIGLTLRQSGAELPARKLP